MSLFGARYYTDSEIWDQVECLEKERERIQVDLARPDISTDPELMPELARKLHELEQFCLVAEDLRGLLKEIRTLEAMMGEEEHNSDDLAELERLHGEYTLKCSEKAARVMQMLVDRGYLDKEIEDEMDLKILRFIDYAGPEYAWRLGINVGLDVVEARRRLEVLLEKGLLERVEGNMLENYHREKGWTKHMNHTYYRITREGRHYLRRLRNKPAG